MKRAYRIFFDAVGDAFDDGLDDGFVVPIRFVVAESHHAPSAELGVPVYFDDAVIELFAVCLQPNKTTLSS